MTNTETTFLIPCTEPACRDYKVGHTMDEYEIRNDEKVMHMTLPFGNDPDPMLHVGLLKLGDDPWTVCMDDNRHSDDGTPEMALSVADTIREAAEKCRELNAQNHY